MNVVTGNIPRVFRMVTDKNTVLLEDPNINFSAQEVLEMYIPQYPQLLNSAINTLGIENDKAVFEFKTVAGTKG